MLPFESDQFDFSQVMMTLAAITYADPADIPNQLNNVHYATRGQWNLVWGPVVSSGNLVYVTRYTPSYGDPVYAVAIRGTVIKFDWATLFNLFEDLESSIMLPWIYPEVPNAYIAGGTAFGLEVLSLMRDRVTGYSLLEFFQQNQHGPVCVTGHSLGGCLTTVLAPWLNYQFGQVGIKSLVIPCSFAAPTAGNQAFADWYNTAFEVPTYRYYNTVDAIPMAWQNLDGIKLLFPGGQPCPAAVADAVNLVNEYLEKCGASYVQPNGNGNPLTGQVTNNPDWFTEMGHQHDHKVYLKLLGAPIVEGTIAVSDLLKRHHPAMLEPAIVPANS